MDVLKSVNYSLKGNKQNSQIISLQNFITSAAKKIKLLILLQIIYWISKKNNKKRWMV